jgi:hypothetical protein
VACRAPGAGARNSSIRRDFALLASSASPSARSPVVVAACSARDMRDHEMGYHQQPEHILAHVPGATDLAGRAALYRNPEISEASERGPDQLGFDSIEVDASLDTERPDDESANRTPPSRSHTRVKPKAKPETLAWATCLSKSEVSIGCAA